MPQINPLVQTVTAGEMAETQPITENRIKIIDSLIELIDKKWADAKQAKESIEDEMLESIRQRGGEYNPTKLAEIKSVDQPEIFMNITDTKCRNAVAWIKDILITGDRIFSVEPTPIPELPAEIVAGIQEKVLMQFIQMFAAQAIQSGQMIPGEQMRQIIVENQQVIKDEVQKQVKQIAKKLSEDIADKIEDDWVEGGFYEALESLIEDIVGMKAAILKGPIFRKVKSRTTAVGQGGVIVKQVTDKIIPTYERRNPFCIYPSPYSTDIDKGYLFDVISLKPGQLYNLIGVEGFNEKEIRDVLREFYAGELRKDWIGLSESAKEGMGDTDKYMTKDTYPDENIYCLELWDEIEGKLLRDWGIEVEDDDCSYPCVICKIGNHIIKAMLNYDQLGRKPFSKASLQNVNDSFWGKDLPEIIKDCQQVCNACARSILANLGIGSLPQTILNMDLLEPNASDKIFPGKVWKLTTEQMLSNNKPLEFFSPNMVVDKLVDVYNTFSRIADEHSGIPAYAHGDSAVGGAGSSLANYEEVITPKGNVRICDLKIGDEVVNAYGSVSKVDGVFPQGVLDIFRLSFSNSTTVDCDMNHRWSVRTHHNRKFRTLTTEEILNKGLFRKTIISWRNPKGWRPKWMLPMVFVEYEPKEVKIDPYTMGVLIGNGDSRCRITGSDKEVFDRIPYKLGKIDRKPNNESWSQTVIGIKKDYHSYGLKCKSIEKFIPKDYLENSREVRLELLRGLMDTDGCCTKEHEVFFSTSSLTLANDFVKLVRSLGASTNGVVIRNNAGYRDFGRGDCFCQIGYSVTFNLNEKLFYVKRKQDRVKNREQRNVYITGIEYIGKHEATCISVDSKDKLFVCGNFIPTHNTSSGLHQLVQMASRGIKAVVRNIDLHIIVTSLQRHYDYLLDNQDVYGIMGDYKFDGRGTSILMKKENVAQRKIEFMQMTANPLDIQLVGPEARRKMLFEVAKTMGIDIDENELQTPMGRPQLAAPQPNPQNLDEAGNPVQGTETRQFNKEPA